VAGTVLVGFAVKLDENVDVSDVVVDVYIGVPIDKD
jgi:hypothetical protein